MTYWTELGQWVNSPGYRDGFPDFSRRVLPRCLDCHASYFESLAPPLNHYRNSGFELGISARSVTARGATMWPGKPRKTQPRRSRLRAIVNPAKLPRDRQIDLCALCHAGIGELTASPSLTFRESHWINISHCRTRIRMPTLTFTAARWSYRRRSRCYQSSTSQE